MSKADTPAAEGNVVELRKTRKDGAPQSALDFVRENPGLAIAGGVVAGLLVGGLLYKGTGRKLARSAISLAEAAGVAGLELGRQTLERAEDAGGELRRQGGALADRAGKLAEPAGEAIDQAGEAAHRLLRKAVELAGKLRA